MYTLGFETRDFILISPEIPFNIIFLYFKKKKKKKKLFI